MPLFDDILGNLRNARKQPDAEIETSKPTSEVLGEGFTVQSRTGDVVRTPKTWRDTHPVNNHLRFYKVDPRQYATNKFTGQREEVNNYDPDYDHGPVIVIDPESGKEIRRIDWHQVQLGPDDTLFTTDIPADAKHKVDVTKIKAPEMERVGQNTRPIRQKWQMPAIRSIWKYRNFKRCGNCGAYDTYQTWNGNDVTRQYWCYTCGARGPRKVRNKETGKIEIVNLVTQKYEEPVDAEPVKWAVTRDQVGLESWSYLGTYHSYGEDPKHKLRTCDHCNETLYLARTGVKVHQVKDEDGEKLLICDRCNEELQAKLNAEGKAKRSKK